MAAPSDDDASLCWNNAASDDSSSSSSDAPADALDAVVEELKSRGYRTCLVVGPGSSGKTTLLRRLGPVIDPGALRWDGGKAVVSQVAPGEAPAAAIERLGSGLSTIPTWTQPFSSLSNGEKARAVVARCLESGVGLDDLGSEVHWRAATTAPRARQLADACTAAAAEALEVDFDGTCSKRLRLLRREDLMRAEFGLGSSADPAPPTVDVRLEPCANEVWDRFKQHHYLARKLSQAARCFVALDAEGAAVAFDSRVSKRGAAFSQSRFVVLPDFQGLGLANALADAVARIHFRVGLLYYSRTSHPRLGASRDRSPKWRACDSNGQAVEATCCLRKRRGYSHVFVGCAAAGDLAAFRLNANAKDLALVLRKTASENYTERGARCARCDAARPRGANHARCAGACGLSYCGDCLAARGEEGAPARWKCSDCAARDAEKDTKKQRPAKKKAKPDAGARSVLSMLSFRPRGASPPPRKPPAARPKPPPSDDAVIVIDHSDDDQSSPATRFSDDDDARRVVGSSSSSDDDDSDDEDFNDEPWMKGGTKRPRRLSAKLD
ncbi:hypothetical protein JL720_10616 [Aureococcus anophagefferens]|nr:hypothetical protein JL720_10616 [Aureococcus anophagefferens]